MNKQQQHTPGPWRTVVCIPNDPRAEAVYAGGDSLTGGMSTANARRIVACVNALEGISTERLESGELTSRLAVLKG